MGCNDFHTVHSSFCWSSLFYCYSVIIIIYYLFVLFLLLDIGDVNFSLS